MQLPDVLQVQVRGSEGGHCGVSRNEVGAFAYGVDHIHDSVKSIGLRKLDNEVDAQAIPAFIRNGKRMEFTHGRMPLGLRPETEVTMAGVGSDVPGHVGPPVAARNELKGLPSAGVSCDLGVMVLGYNSPTQVR